MYVGGLTRYVGGNGGRYILDSQNIVPWSGCMLVVNSWFSSRIREDNSASNLYGKLNMLTGTLVSFAASTPTTHSRTLDLAPSQPTRTSPVAELPSLNSTLTFPSSPTEALSSSFPYCTSIPSLNKLRIFFRLTRYGFSAAISMISSPVLPLCIGRPVAASGFCSGSA